MEDKERYGEVGRARLGVAAVEVLADMRASARTVPTDKELGVLAKWPGWGPMAKAFDPPDQTWAEIGERLRELLPEADLKVAMRGTYNAFFTPQPIAKAMWDLAAAFGYKAGPVGELGCGSGRFLGTAPDGAVMTGVERDPTSAAIAQLLYPAARIIGRRLEETPLHSGFSLVIGNVPFGDVQVFDPAVPQGMGVLDNLHGYFLYRGVKALAPGGLLMVLTSRFVMDAREYKQRVELSEIADFVGAIRLPNGALDGEQGEGGTQACADIVILRRKDDDDAAARGHWWRDTSYERFGWSNQINQWWEDRPEFVLGEMVQGHTGMYGLNVLVKPREGHESLPDQIRKAGRKLARMARERKLLLSVPDRPEEWNPFDHNVVSQEGWLENSFHLTEDGQVLVVVDGKAQPKPRPHKELIEYIKLRDLVKELLDAEADHRRPDASIEPLRRDVRATYERYVRQYKPLNWATVVNMGIDEETGLDRISRRAPARGGARHDPDWYTVAAIENYDEETRTAKPAPILYERQNRPVVRPTSADTPAEALALCLDYKGGEVDLAYIGALLYNRSNVDHAEIAAQLGDAIYQQPGDGRWVTAEEYLSGDVRAKHLAAKTAAKHNPAYERNVTALERVLPKWLGPGDIRASLGAVWIPEDDVAQFTADLLGARAVVKRIKEGNRWEVAGGFEFSTAATAVWGTAHYNGYRLLELALNGEKPVVRKKIDLGEGRSTVKRDDDGTLQACEMQQRIKDRFAQWVWEDPDRCERLVNKYNNTFNCLVARQYNGDHITFEGLAPEWVKKVYKHQKAFVARALATPATLCGLPVGSGKTFMMVSSAIKLRQVGLVNKPMLVVPNHLLDQVDREARQMYPGAQILTASAETISANRRAFAARVTMSPWDLVIITMSAFNAMSVNAETEREYQEAKADAVHEAVFLAAPRQGKMSRAVKNLAKKLDRVEAKVKNLRRMARGRDAGCTFEQLGVDWVGIDEAHNWKNLDVDCRNEGFNIQGSKRATDLDVKLRWLKNRRAGGRYAALFTGTPISNSMLELFIFMRYTMPDYLESLDLGSADAWVSTFVEMVTKVGVSINGADFELQTKPARFINAPELRVQLSLVADIQTAEMLGLQRPKAIDRTVAIDPTSAQEEYAEELVERARRLKGVRFPGKGQDNMLRVCTHGRWMATDPALVGLIDHDRNKLDYVAANMLQMWREHPDMLQIGFLDIGTPKPDDTQSYGRLRRMLTDGGMPVDRIRFIHDAKTDAAKARLFADCRAGKVSVILGSTGKLGTGTNIQDLVIAMHHIDAPYTPSGVEQRNGRGLRPGNVNEEVYVFTYVTKRTFDAYLWQLLVRKLGFISQMMSGNLDRTIEDCDTDQLMSFEAVQAAATDQPLLLEKADVASTVARLEGLYRGHRGMVAQMKHNAPQYRRQADHIAAEAAAWEALDAADVQITEEVAEELHAAMERHSKYGPPVVQVGTLRIAMRSWDLVGKETTKHPLPTIETGMGEIQVPKIYNWTKAEQLRKVLIGVITGAAEAAAALRRTEAHYRAEAVAADEAAKQPFEHADELTAARARLDQIDAELREVVEKDRQKDTDVVVDETAAKPDPVITTVPGSAAKPVKVTEPDPVPVVVVPNTVPAAIAAAMPVPEPVDVDVDEDGEGEGELNLDFDLDSLDFSVFDGYTSDAERKLAEDMAEVFGDLFA